ncbi:hypothetical protein J6590_096889 [Homalodisca vitripennis]|nr:hypothetical protein J6590_096889 [Homalodisca vitripennis]
MLQKWAETNEPKPVVPSYTVRNHSCEHVPLWLTSMVAGGWPSPWPPLHTKAARLPGTAQEERTVAYTGV